MKTAIVMFVIGAVLGSFFVIPVTKSELAEKQAEKQVCIEMAADVKAGTVTQSTYMTTRCSAQLLIQGNDNDAND